MTVRAICLAQMITKYIVRVFTLSYCIYQSQQRHKFDYELCMIRGMLREALGLILNLLKIDYMGYINISRYICM